MPKDPGKVLEELARRLESRVAGCLWAAVTRISTRLKTDLLAGGVLRRRRQGLPVVRQKPHLVGTVMTAAVISPVSWAGVHIGPPGATIITAKSGGFLAIPTDFVRQSRGSAAGPKHYSGTVIFGGIIWGKAGWGGARTGGGLRQHRAGGEKFKKQDLIPLFILKKSVIVPRRLNPADIVAAERAPFLADLKKVLNVT